jgi:ligand-binding sensor domain-containing protein
VILLTPAVQGQFRINTPVRLTEEKKLPASDVRCIRIAGDGFVWIGTNEGLCRFDGQAYKLYRHLAYDSTSLLDETVNSVLPLPDEVWVATSLGISVLDKKTERFRHYQIGENGKLSTLDFTADNNISVLYQDKRGDTWIGTRSLGVWRYNKGRDDFESFPFPSSSYPALNPTLTTNKSVLSIQDCSINDSIVWVGTGAGLQRINIYTRQVSWFTFARKEKDQQVAINAFRRLYSHNDGLLYTGTWNAGVNIFDPQTQRLTALPVQNQPGADLLTTPINAIAKKSDSEIWISTNSGLLLYNTKLKKITLTRYNDISRNEFYGYECSDSMNRIWFNGPNGVLCFDPVMQQFSTYSYSHLYGNNWGFTFYIKQEESENCLIVCPRLSNGLYRFHLSTKKWDKLYFRHTPLANQKLTVRGFEKIAGGIYLISADQGLFFYNMKKQILEPMKHPPKAVFNQWGSVVKDATQKIWIAANADGLICYDISNGKTKTYQRYLFSERDTVPMRPSNLFADSKNNIWFSCQNGFGVYINQLDSMMLFTSYSRKENNMRGISSFAEDSAGRIWINSSEAEIGYCSSVEPGKGIIKKITLPERKIRGEVFGLTTDKDGYVWGYTQHDVFRIAGIENSFDQFSFQYGAGKSDFFHFSFLVSGEMVFGGRNSITLANPKDLQRNRELPVPYVTELRVLNNNFDLSQYTAGKGISLDHRQNFFTFLFSAKAFSMADEIRFRYRLLGFDDWKEVTGERSANYTNVPPGSYQFQLQAANNEGIWNESIYQIPIFIATPFWQTWWFRIGGSLFALGTIAWLYFFRVDQVRKKEKLKSQYEKKLANVEMSALLAQMNPHFLFNSLNSIDSYIIKNESKKASEYLNNFARLMRLILQNSRSNYISLREEVETLDLYLQMERLRFNNRFYYSIDIEENLDPASVLIPPMLIQPYVENAIWHGLMHKNLNEPGKVVINLKKIDNNLVCVVEDNGIGRAKASEIRVQKPGNKKKSMGMQITRDRMEMINKLYNTSTSLQITDLSDENGQASGTRVELIIPI